MAKADWVRNSDTQLSKRAAIILSTVLSGAGAASPGASLLSKFIGTGDEMSLTIRDVVVPTVGALRDQLIQTGKSGALAFGVIGGRLYNPQTGLAVVVRARFGNPDIKFGKPGYRDFETLPLIEVLKRVHAGDCLAELAAPDDSLHFVAVARLVKRDLTVGLRDDRGGLATAAVTTPKPSSPPTRPSRDHKGMKSTQTDREIQRMGARSADDFAVIDAETLVLDIDSQKGLTAHRKREQTAEQPRPRWHYWKVLRGDHVVVSSDDSGHRNFVAGPEENEYWVERAAEIDALPARVLFRPQSGGKKVTFAPLHNEIPAEAEFEAKVIAQADFDTLVERAKLPQGQRKVVSLLRQNPDMTEEDGARELGISRLNFRTQRDRAFERIRQVGPQAL